VGGVGIPKVVSGLGW